MNDDNKKYLSFLGRIQEYIDSLPNEEAKALASQYLSQIPTDENAQRRNKVFSSDKNLYSCSFDNMDENHTKSFLLSASKGSAQTRISLTLNTHDNHRENEQNALDSHKMDEPEGLKRLNPLTMKKWNTRNQELLDQLYAPGKKESFAEFSLQITETLINGSTDVMITFSENTTDNIITPDKKDEAKKSGSAYTFKNGQLVPNEKQSGTETSL